MNLRRLLAPIVCAFRGHTYSSAIELAKAPPALSSVSVAYEFELSSGSTFAVALVDGQPVDARVVERCGRCRCERA